MQDIEKAYEKMLHRWDFKINPKTSGRERRNHPRFAVPQKDVNISVEIHAPALDVSLSGISFRSSLRLETGARITVRFGHAISGSALVVACEPERGDPVAGPIEYRVRCVFDGETIGMPLVVVLNDQETKKASGR